MMLAEVTPKLSWYAARASGLVAWSLVTVAIICGLALATRLVRRRGVPAWLLDLHTFLGTLTVVFVAVHLLALVADNYVTFGWRELFVPFASRWRPVAVAWGICAMYLLAAIQVTSWMRSHLPRKLWHRVHLTSIPMFVMATVHGFTSGADRTNLVVQWAALSAGLLVVFLLVFRVLGGRTASRASTRVPPSPARQLA